MKLLNVKFFIILLNIVLLLLYKNIANAQAIIGSNVSGVQPNLGAWMEMTNGALPIGSSRGFLIARANMSAIANTSTFGLNGAGTAGIMVYNTGTGNGFTPGLYIWTGTAWQQTATSSSAWATTGNTGTDPATQFIGTTDAQDFAIRTDNTEKMRVTSAGNVGIGTDNPNYKLDVIDEIRINGSRINYSSARIILEGDQVDSGNQGNGIYILDGFGAGVRREWYFGKPYGEQGLAIKSMQSDIFDVSAAALATTHLYIDGVADRIGIGTNVPSYKLDVVGDMNASGNVRAAGIILTSDARLKTNIKRIENAIETINKLNPVSYDKKENFSDTNYKKSEIGFLAQEVQKILPQLVSEGKDANKILALDYNSLIPLLTKSIQEQQVQIKAKDTEIKAVKAEIAELKALIKEIISRKN